MSNGLMFIVHPLINMLIALYNCTSSEMAMQKVHDRIQV